MNSMASIWQGVLYTGNNDAHNNDIDANDSAAWMYKLSWPNEGIVIWGDS